MIAPPSGPGRPPRSTPRLVAAGFAMGLLLSLATSGGIAEERITRGAFAVALVANGVTTGVALLAVLLMMRGLRVFRVEPPEARAARVHPLTVLVPQGLGAVAGIVLVHVLLRREVLGSLPWLSERPAQFVNDAVAVSGFLALVWAAAGGLDARLLLLAFAGATLYRMTAPMWHLDRAPGGFHTSVQELVVAQLVGAALALGLFRTAMARAER
jgi:hypothetical protein